MKHCPRQAGFTLFEMVVAVSIFALMGVIALTGLNYMTRNGRDLADANERLASLQFAVVYFSRDWTQVSPRRIRDQYGDEQPSLRLEEESISFTRNGLDNLLDLPRSTLQRVQYLVEDNKLLRRHWLSLDQGIGEEPIQRVMLDHVEALEIVLQDREGRPIRSWPPDPGDDAEKPVLLALRLQLEDIGDIVRLLEIPDGAI